MSSSRRKVIALGVCAFLVYALIAAGFQVFSGAYSGEFGGHPDEAGHLVTGLMIRDYLAQGLPGSPMRFSENYYLHYPKVALGHWPPLFYLVQAGWTLFLPPSRGTLLALMAVLAALLATTLFLFLRPRAPPAHAFVAGLALLLLPLVRDYSAMLMADLLSALLAFPAALAFGRFLNTSRARDALGFGVFAALAILNKGSGFELALIPPLGLLFGRRLDLLKRPAFWLPVLVVALLCGPWYVFAFDKMKNGFENPQGLASSVRAVFYYFPRLFQNLGIAISALAVLGLFWRMLRSDGQGRPDGAWAAMAALLIGVPVFHCVITNADDTRYLLPALPAALALATVGALDAVGRFGASRRNAAAIAIGVIAVALMPWTQRPAVIRNSGCGAVAQALLSGQDARLPVYLISSDVFGEGMFIAGIALREARPGHFTLRASKALAKSLWTGGNYEPLFKDHEELQRHLESLPVGIVVIDNSVPQDRVVPHHALLRETVERNPQAWAKVGAFPMIRNGTAVPNALLVYRLKTAAEFDPKRIRINMDHMLGRSIDL